MYYYHCSAFRFASFLFRNPRLIIVVSADSKSPRPAGLADPGKSRPRNSPHFPSSKAWRSVAEFPCAGCGGVISNQFNFRKFIEFYRILSNFSEIPIRLVSWETARSMPCAGRSTADLGTAGRRCTVIHNHDPGRFTGPGRPTASWPPPDASASDARPANGRWSPRGRIPAAHAWARRAPPQPAPLVCLEGSRARRGTHRDREALGSRPDRDHITLRTSRAIRCANPPSGSPRALPKTCCRAPGATPVRISYISIRRSKRVLSVPWRRGRRQGRRKARGRVAQPLLQRAAFALPAQAVEVAMEHRRLRPREAGRAGALLPAVPVPRPVALVPLAPVAI